MTHYSAPIDEMRFVLQRIVGLDAITGLPGYGEATPDVVDAVLNEAGRLASEVLAPLNHPGDREGCILENGVVRTPQGFTEAYRLYCEGGWNALPFPEEIGGQGLPWVVAMAVQEMWHAANMAFALCPTLNQGAVELLASHGSPEQKALFLDRLVSGTWTGTMNLTEPQAGSDVGALRARAVRHADGSYRLFGQKIFITYGEHDLAENIVHMVLARTPDAPPGIRGVSLFIVPKFLMDANGALGARNDLRCVSLEHKLGIHACPTCVMAFGDEGGAVGQLVGEECRGIEYMFTMMNNARLSIGIQGVAIAERAYQQALSYARMRIQGRSPDGGNDSVPIIRHPDIRRMLLDMRARIEAARALAYRAAAALDVGRRHPDADTRRAALDLADLLIPVAKAWCTDIGVEVASIGLQVHGGTGFIEETGAAQHYRDARIAPIYEGTNGIQAADLVFRKIRRDDGRCARAFIGEILGFVDRADAASGTTSAAILPRLKRAADALAAATDHVLRDLDRAPSAAAAAATPYLRMFGIVTGGYLMARAAAEAATARAAGDGSAFLAGKETTARFYAETMLPMAEGLLVSVTDASRTVRESLPDHF